ncbi:UNVERIFIED_CONTAM: hypothetical protein Sradi_0172100 [Sesamum radiatum]|uniref:RNase H type-1 domain-containing protein n=1 Tax=Sesamum radiatum TaxID=300843 RepID=A0AAW2W2V8_SESRA
MLQGAEKRYIQIELLALALVTMARKLRPYFQSHPIVVLTNHPLKQAEYEALIYGLQTTLDGGVKEVDVYTDSQLVAMQVEGIYESREWSVVQYLRKVKEMMAKFDRCQIHQIPREENDRADVLSKFGAPGIGVKERKVSMLIKEIRTIEEAIHVVEGDGSWKCWNK